MALVGDKFKHGCFEGGAVACRAFLLLAFGDQFAECDFYFLLEISVGTHVGRENRGEFFFQFVQR